MTNRETLYQTIDQLPEPTFLELVRFVEFLQFKEWHGAELKKIDNANRYTSDKRKRPRKAGSAKHLKMTMSDDFDEPLDDFSEYM